MLQVLRDPAGHILGRAALLGRERSRTKGVVAVGGLRVGTEDRLGGILLGSIKDISRSRAAPLADECFLALWASAQASVISEAIHNDRLKLFLAMNIYSLGGDFGALPFARFGGKYIGREYLASWHDAPNEVFISWIHDLELHDFYYEDPLILFPAYLDGPLFLRIVIESLAEVWGCSPETITQERSMEHRFKSIPRLNRALISPLHGVLILRRPPVV